MSRNATFSDFLRSSAERHGVVSAGYDPAPVDFPHEGIEGYDDQLPNPVSEYDSEAVRETILTYFQEFAEEMKSEGVRPGAFKPNIAYFEMYNKGKNTAGTGSLVDTIEGMNEFDVPVILDAKDADIGRSSAAYGISKLDSFDVDAMTVHPEMGSDSVHPFFELAHQNQQGVYVLTRTTNDGAEDFQDKVSEDQPMYMHIAENVVEWSEEYPGTVGSVAAGNKTEELREIASLLSGADADIPLLIPGVGTQGGEADEVINTLLEVDYDPRLARINSSSGVMYRAQKDGRPREEHAEASVGELRELNQATDFEVEFVR